MNCPVYFVIFKFSHHPDYNNKSYVCCNGLWNIMISNVEVCIIDNIEIAIEN